MNGFARPITPEEAEVYRETSDLLYELVSKGHLSDEKMKRLYNLYGKDFDDGDSVKRGEING